VIPAGLGLKKDGASSGAAVGFLISTPQTGVDSILVGASFLGWPFALFKVLAATVTGLMGGWITDRGGRGQESVQDNQAPASDARPHDIREMAEHAVDILRSIWRWLVFGIVVSAAITTWVPEDFFTGLERAGSLVPILAALAVSLPLYVCATASVPIAAALVASGMPAGAALVFLMAGPATNVATIGAVYRGLGRRALTVYLTTIVVGSIGAGLLFDSVVSSTAVQGVHVHGETTWWAVGSAILLVGLLGKFAIDDLRRWIAPRLARPAAPESSKPLVFTVEGMSCQNCVASVERAVRSVEGVRNVEISLKPGRALIHGDVDEYEVRAAVTSAGYAASKT
jgi:copper chaperone CopZ